MLHKKKIIHKDVKPSKLLMTDDGVIKLSDLGYSKDLQEILQEKMKKKND